VRLRPATDADDAFCFELNEVSLREYIEPIYGWDMDAQRMYHARWFDPARLTIIEDGGDAIGVLDVSDEGDHLYLSRIEILPEVQGRGVGTAVMRDSCEADGRSGFTCSPTTFERAASTKGWDSASTTMPNESTACR
jgi:GNAT superfamily N-acetyltransferase